MSFLLYHFDYVFLGCEFLLCYFYYVMYFLKWIYCTNKKINSKQIKYNNYS